MRHFEKIKVSCVIPIYNAERYLKDTLLSVMNQSLWDIEIICVDDNSKDNSAAIVKQLQQWDDRIKLFYMQKHYGAAICRNYGLNCARGKYVVFLDADDFFFAKMLETAYNAAENSKADLVVWDYNMVPIMVKGNQEIKSVGRQIKRTYREISSEEVTINILKNIDNVPWNKLVSRKLLRERKIFFQDLPANNDIFYSAAVALNANKIIFLGQTLMEYYFGRKDSLTQNRMEKKEYTIAAYTYVYSYISQCEKTRVTGIDYLSYILEWIFKSLCSSSLGENVKEDILKELRSNPILCSAMKEYKENRAFKMHNRIFIERIESGKYNLGENYYYYYIDEFKEFQRKSGDRKVALWGCGVYGKRFLDMLAANDLFVDFVVDNDKDKQGCVYKGNEIYSYEKVKDEIADIIVLNFEYMDEVKEQAVGKRVIDINCLCEMEI